MARCRLSTVPWSLLGWPDMPLDNDATIASGAACLHVCMRMHMHMYGALRDNFHQRTRIQRASSPRAMSPSTNPGHANVCHAVVTIQSGETAGNCAHITHFLGKTWWWKFVSLHSRKQWPLWPFFSILYATDRAWTAVAFLADSSGGYNILRS